jgi:hypothetical protein
MSNNGSLTEDSRAEWQGLLLERCCALWSVVVLSWNLLSIVGVLEGLQRFERTELLPVDQRQGAPCCQMAQASLVCLPLQAVDLVELIEKLEAAVSVAFIPVPSLSGYPLTLLTELLTLRCSEPWGNSELPG